MAEDASTPLTTVYDRAAHRAAAWVRASVPADDAPPPSGLRAFLADAQSRAFAFGAVDSVLRPDSLAAAAAHFHRLAPSAPADLPWHVRSAIRASGAMAPVLPSPVVPVVRSAMRMLIADITCDARPKKIDASIAAATAGGARLELAVPATNARSDAEARAHRQRIMALIERDDVTAVSYRLGHAAHLGDLWDFAELVDSAVAAVTELYVAAAVYETRLLLDVRELRELDLAIAVFAEVLEGTGTMVSAGMSVPAALADSHDAVRQLAAWAREREHEGAAPITIRLTDSAGSNAERDENILNGWPQPALAGRVDILAAQVRGIDVLLADENAGAVDVSVATHDPFVLAYAAESSSPERAVEIVLQAGFAPEWESLVVSDATLTLASLALTPRELDGAVDAIAERLSVAAGVIDDLARLTEEDMPAYAAEIARRAQTNPPLSRRTLDRSAEIGDIAPGALLRPIATDSVDLTQAVMGIAGAAKLSQTSALDTAVDGLFFGGTPFVETAVFSERETDDLAYGAAGFRNAQTTDPSLAANREWALATRERDGADSAEGVGAEWHSAADAVVLIRHGHGEWEALAAAERALVLEHAAHHLEARRSDLIVAARPRGILFSDADRDVTTAVDFARYYAATVRELDAVSGAIFVPAGITIVAGSSADLIASTAEGVLATLAAGGAAIVVATPHQRAVVALIADALWHAGVPHDALCVAAGTVHQAAEETTVDSIVMSGPAADVHAISSRQLNARVHGRNTVIIAPSADIDEAAAALVTSAFSRDGAAFESVSLKILAGGIARSDRLSAALVELTTSWAERAERLAQARIDRGEARHVALDEGALWALTTLEPGQRWLVEPRELADGTYTPGIRVGVEPGSRFASERFAAPVLGILSAGGVGAATIVANSLSTGAVAGLFTTDPADAERWLRQAEAGSLHINRATIDPVVQRQPSGGWHGAVVGSAAKAGGPNRLATLGTWRPTAGRAASGTLHLRGLDSRVTSLIEAAQPDLEFDDFDWVRRAALSDALAWDREFGHIRDVTRLGIERNLFRYRPTTIALRACAETPVRVVVRLVIAAVRSQADFTLSTAEGLPLALRRALGEAGITLFVETDAEFVQRVVASRIARVRLTGADAADTAALIRDESVVPVATFSHPATTVGRVELLAYLREQTVSIGGRSVAAFADVI
ncbi:proline dehydrogenase family protein [Microbacterium sp. YY-03]|uniref:proline dehydrogenase family protein n=1 Tax=Microbacterium sp. YY-03 TaxID=3421636 RepID=UPI003D16ED60